MALTYEERAGEVMRHLVRHDAHGYSQPNRKGDGTIETITLTDGTVTSVHGGDYDCSEAVRMSYVAAGVLPRGCYMWTGNEVALLEAHSFRLLTPQTDVRIGDVLWRKGHTEMIITADDALWQAGFRQSEHGTTTGTKGDQTGYEAAYSAYKPSAWAYLLRYAGAEPTGAERITVPATKQTVSKGTYRCVVSALNVRTGPGTSYRSVAKYRYGQTVTLDGFSYIADGCVWGRYVGASSGRYRYVAVRTQGGMEYLTEA